MDEVGGEGFDARGEWKIGGSFDEEDPTADGVGEGLEIAHVPSMAQPRVRCTVVTCEMGPIGYARRPQPG
ncbi:MAG: hypothetical protein EA397_12135 [Deltaproteobacteria bacterium]|nr:MAG: hypothetical protein EA397_12135 [Deltaproteobacteria bacterium]